MIRTATLSVLMCVSVCVSAPASVPAIEHSYVYRDAARPLALDPTRVAVHAADAAAALADAGVRTTAIEPHGIPGWSLATLAPDARGAAGVHGALARLTATPGAETFASPVFFDDLGGPLLITRDVFVGFAPGVAPGRAEQLIAAAGAGAVVARDWRGLPGVYRVRSASRDGRDVLAAANRLARLAETTFAEPDLAFTGLGSLFPNDQHFPHSWGLHNTGQNNGTPDQDMDAPEAWDLTIGDPSIVIVVIDTGVQLDHPDLHMGGGRDFTGQGGDGGPFNECDIHGTSVAGCATAHIDNAIGTTGVAPGCRTATARAMISEPACDVSWRGTGSWTADAIMWARDIGARVTNNSNRYGTRSSLIDAAYAATRGQGIVHFASVGNQGTNDVAYPADLASVNGVGAVTRSGNRPAWSNYGNGIAFMAPGEQILTTDRTGDDGWTGGDYVWLTGTSVASPYAAGVAALVLSRQPALNAAQVEQVIHATCVDRAPPGFDMFYGSGFVNAHAALCADFNLVNNGPPVWSSGVSISPRTTANRFVPDADGAATHGVFSFFFDGQGAALGEVVRWSIFADGDDAPGRLVTFGDATDLAIVEIDTDHFRVSFPIDQRVRLRGETTYWLGLEAPEATSGEQVLWAGSNFPSADSAVSYRYPEGAWTPSALPGLSFTLLTNPCVCSADINGDGDVGNDDLVALLAAWGDDESCPPFKPADIDQDCDVGYEDLLALLGQWGTCP